MKLAVILLFVPILLGMISSVCVVNGSSESETNCYEKRSRDGEEHPFDQNTYDDCGNSYYRGFIKGREIW